MKFSSLNFGLLLAAVVKASSPIGWGKNTVGGEGGVEYHVSTYKEFKDALDNNGNPTGPKIIYIEAPINGISLDDGSIMNFESLVPGFSLDSYIACFSEDGSEWLDTPECNTIEELRQQGRPIQSGQIHVDVTPNTTIIGNGNDAKLVELSLQIRHTENVIIKNLSVEAPNDYFPEWDPTDGIHGSWNAEYDAIVIKNATNVWVDNCYLGDGSTGVGTFPEVFGHHIETHDGLLDVVDGADYITISNNRFENHKKTMLIGNSDKKTTDRDHLKVTLYNNVFINCNERMPRVRFGKVHVFNNYFYAETFNEAYESLTVNNYFHNDEVFPQYFMGLGVECNILSEYNSFHYAGNEEIPASDDIVVYSYGGYTFHDNGSEYNGESIDLDTLAEESFKLKVKTKMAQNARDGKENPEWVNAAFTTESFVPSEYYDYEVVENIEYVDDLINKVPSWMFGTPDEIETVEDTVLPEDTPFEPEIINEPETTEPSEPEQPQVEQPQPEQPQIEQPQVEQPQVEQPQVEQPQVEQPQVEQPQVEQPQVEQPQVEQPQVEQPQPEQPQPEQPQPEQQPPQQVQPPQEQQPQPPQQLPPKQPPQQIQPGQQVQPPHQPQQPQPPQQIQPPQQPQQPQQPQGSYNDQSIRYYSCGPQDYQCKNRMSNECYTSLSQCFSQSQVSDHEKCQELNRICSKIWS